MFIKCKIFTKGWISWETLHNFLHSQMTLGARELRFWLLSTSNQGQFRRKKTRWCIEHISYFWRNEYSTSKNLSRYRFLDHLDSASKAINLYPNSRYGDEYFRYVYIIQSTIFDKYACYDALCKVVNLYYVGRIHISYCCTVAWHCWKMLRS